MRPRTLTLTVVVLIMAVMAMGCSTSNSLKKSTASSGLDVYFSKAEIVKTYDVVGSATGCCNCPLKKKQICDKFIDRAKQKNADAILIEELKVAKAEMPVEYQIKASYIRYM